MMFGGEYWWNMLRDYQYGRCSNSVCVPDKRKTKQISRREYMAFINMMRKLQIRQELD
jgi:hypothetical protein